MSPHSFARWTHGALVLVALSIVVEAAPPRGGAGQPLAIAAASDLQAVMPQVTSRFEQATGRRVRVSFGSSGNFVSQIENGAPFDVFFSADIAYPRRLEAAGLVERGSIVTYAIGRIVLWARRGSPVDARRGLGVLVEPAVRRIAIANPEHAPYGRAAVAALRHERLYDRVKSKLVLGENVSQAAQFVDSGNADVGIFALSLAMDPALGTRGTYYEIPASFHPAIEQAAAVLQSSKNKAAAHRFLDFLRSPAIVRLMGQSGFSTSQPAPAAR